MFNREELADKTVLDLGSGLKAKLAKQLKDAGINTEVVSVSPDFSERKYGKEVKKSLPEGKFVAALGQALPFKDESFDRVFALHVIEHFRSGNIYKKCLIEIPRILKEGGKATLGPLPFFHRDYEDILEHKEIMEIFEHYGVQIVKEDIPKENLFADSIKGDGDSFAPRIKNVTFYNLVLLKSGNNE